MKAKLTSFLVWCGLVALFVVLFSYTKTPDPIIVDYSNFEEYVEMGSVRSLRIDRHELHFELSNDPVGHYLSFGTLGEQVLESLNDQGVFIEFGSKEPWYQWLIIYVLPIVLLLLLFIYFAKRHVGGQQTNLITLRKSRARLLDKEQNVTFAEVGGSEEAKEHLADVVDFLKHPEHWISAGARLPRGVLLEGPPGCGKTLLARAVAGETEASFYTVSGSEFVELFVGIGAARVRDMFEEARSNVPAVIFIDELDAVGRRRGSGIGAGHDEREQTLNQLLVCLDGFEKNDRVVVIAASNRADVLDTALLRPGRFDRRISIAVPSEKERLAILKIHCANKNLSEDVSLEALAEKTESWVGAALESLCNDAAINAVRRVRSNGNGEVAVTAADFEKSLNRIREQERRFSAVDVVLIESASQLAEPQGAALVRIILEDGSELSGRMIWADASFVKVLRAEDEAEVLVPKCKIKTLETSTGSSRVDAADVQGDRWASHNPDLG